MNTYKDATVVPTRCTVLVGTARGTLGDINGDGVIDLTEDVYKRQGRYRCGS